MRHLVERVKQTTQHAARGLRRTPGYSLAVALSLALGLGLNTTVFAIIEGVLLRRLPYPNESELVTVGHVNVRGDAQGASSPTWRSNDIDLQAWRTGTRTLESFAFFSSDHRVVAGTATPEYVDGAEASPSLPRVLGASVDQGRWFTDAEVSARVVVVSHGLWQRQFAGDSAVLGRVLKIQGEAYTVIGVMRRGIGLPLGAQYWVPSTGMDGQVVGRLRDGIRPTVVEQELTALSPSVRNLQGAGYTSTIVVVPLREHLFGSARPALRLAFGAAALLLLIACANVANLSLARSLEREREFAVRITLGASRRSLASLVVSENLLLAVVGAAAGMVLAFWWTRLAIAISPEQIGRADEIGINASVMVFGGVVAVVAAFVVSIVPIMTATHRDVQPILSGAGPVAGRHRGGSQRVRRTLVATQLALALILMTGAGLLIRSVARLTRIDHLGFSPSGVVIASVYLPGNRYRAPGRRDQFVNELSTRLRALPAVEAVGLGPPPLVGGRGEGLREGFNVLFTYQDTTRVGSPVTTVWVKHVDAGYLETYRMRLRAGRSFRASDDSASAPVAILNAAAAQLFLGRRPPLGQRLVVPGLRRDGREVQVVGMVDDVLQRDLALTANPEVLLPIAQQSAMSPMPTIAVRAAGASSTIIAALRDALRELDPELAATRLEPMQAVVDASLARHRFLLFLLGVFAVLALVLSAIGLYAVVSYLVSQRTLEIGVRMALGAQRHHVFGLVLHEGVILVALGVVIGVPSAFGLSRLLERFVYEIAPHDLATFMTAPALLAVVALCAAYVPARRAAKLDPARALRAE